MEKEEYLDDAEFDFVYDKFEEFWNILWSEGKGDMKGYGFKIFKQGYKIGKKNNGNNRK